MSDSTNNPVRSITLQKGDYNRAAFLLTLITGLLMSIISIVSFILTRATGLNSNAGVYLTSTLALIGFLSAYLCYHHGASLGINLLLSSLLVATLSLPFLANGQVLPLAIMTFSIISSIANATLPISLAKRYTFASLSLGVAITIADLYLPTTFGTPSDSRVIIPISIVISILFLIPIFQQFNSFTLQNKLIISFIALTSIPLLILGVYTNTTTRQQSYETATTDMAEIADLTAYQVQNFIDNQLISIFVDAQDPEYEEFLLLSPEEQRDPKFQRNIRSGLDVLARRSTIFIRSIAIINTSGINVLDTNEANIGRSEGKFEFFNQSFQTSLRSVTGPVFNQQNGEASLYFSAPIRNKAGRIIGVLRTEYDAAVIQALINTVASTGENDRIISILTNDTLMQIAYTGNQKYLYKTVQDINKIQFEILQSKNLFPPGPLNEVSVPVQELTQGLQNLPKSPFFFFPSLTLDGNSIATGATLDIVPWYVVVEQSQVAINEPFERQNRILIFIALGLAGTTTLAAVFLSRLLSAPILLLGNVSNNIASGNFSARAEVETSDEIGILAVTINKMAEQLQQIFAGLESQVNERTNALKQSSIISESRAQNLQTISEISRAISLEQRLDSLLSLVTHLLNERYNFYHVGIFIMDDTQRFAVLQAATSEGGKRMLDRGHRLEVGSQGIVGYVSATGRTRVALNVGDDMVFFNNPDLPATRSEIALPLRVGGEVIGVLDVQSSEPNAFQQDIIDTLSTLADQVAIAIQNAKSYESLQGLLREAQRASSLLMSESWRVLTQEQARVFGYQATESRMIPLAEPLASDQVNKAMASISTIRKNGERAALVIPIRLRDRVIGVFDIQVPGDHDWSQDDVDLAEAVAERLSLSLEALLLLKATQRRAEVERLTADISTRIGATTQFDSILQTAAEELSRALGGSEVLVQIQSDSWLNTEEV